jgi:hypothetical protein
MAMRQLESFGWWSYLELEMRELIKQSNDLIEQEIKRRDELKREVYRDYSFIVFPAAKAYEGFLKKLFLDLKLISRQQYFGEHFRIGRALSPTLPKRYRSGWVYGKLIGSCEGEELPMKMWEVWKKGRNRVFHYFPNFFEALSLDRACEIVTEIEDMMEECLLGCRIK